MYILRISIFLFLCNFGLEAQRSCAAHDMFQEQMATNPIFKDFQKKAERISTNRLPVEGVITIPVVVHVVYNHAGENISDAQIQSQLDVLNDDFRKMNSDADNLWGQAADAEIEFCLASRDTYGDATCGITRTYTDSTKFRVKTSMKSEATGGKTGWPADEYLNMWVCDISGLLGFATFPGGNLNIDGIVTDYLSFGTIGNLKPDFALGRTTTHEIGHWLNLRHIWGDGDCFYDDFVSDTPVSDDHNYGCNPGHVSCGSVDMVQNYMDYSDDVCMNLFTTGQKARMRALFEPGGFRESLLTSKGCDAPLTCNSIFITINFDDYPADISWNLKDASAMVIASGGGYSNATYANQTIDFSYCLPDGNYTFNIIDSYGDGLCCNEGAGSYSISTTYEDIYTSSGTFGSGETYTLQLDDSGYRFVGPGNQWEDSSNWNKLDPPSDCYQGQITIESDCEVNGMNLESTNSIMVKTGAQLKVK